MLRLDSIVSTLQIIGTLVHNLVPQSNAHKRCCLRACTAVYNSTLTMEVRRFFGMFVPMQQITGVCAFVEMIWREDFPNMNNGFVRINRHNRNTQHFTILLFIQLHSAASQGLLCDLG